MAKTAPRSKTEFNIFKLNNFSITPFPLLYWFLVLKLFLAYIDIAREVNTITLYGWYTTKFELCFFFGHACMSTSLQCRAKKYLLQILRLVEKFHFWFAVQKSLEKKSIFNFGHFFSWFNNDEWEYNWEQSNIFLL